MQNLDTMLMQLTTEAGQLGRRAAKLIVDMAQQWEADKNFRIKHQDMQVVETDLAQALAAYREVNNKEFFNNMQ